MHCSLSPSLNASVTKCLHSQPCFQHMSPAFVSEVTVAATSIGIQTLHCLPASMCGHLVYMLERYCCELLLCFHGRMAFLAPALHHGRNKTHLTAKADTRGKHHLGRQSRHKHIIGEAHKLAKQLCLLKRAPIVPAGHWSNGVTVQQPPRQAVQKELQMPKCSIAQVFSSNHQLCHDSYTGKGLVFSEAA